MTLLRNEERLFREGGAISVLAEPLRSTAPEASSSSSQSFASSSTEQIPATVGGVQDTDSVTVRGTDLPIAPASPPPFGEVIVPAEVLPQGADPGALRRTEQPGLGLLYGHGTPSSSNMLSQSDREVVAIAEVLRQDDSAALRSTEQAGLGRGLYGSRTPSPPSSGSGVMSPPHRMMAALAEVLEEDDSAALRSTEQLGLGLSEHPSPSPLSAPNDVSRSDRGAAALAEVSLQRDDSASNQATTEQQRGVSRSPAPSSNSPFSALQPSGSPQPSPSPQTLAAAFSRLHLRMDEAERRKEATLVEAQQKVELLLRERRESNDAARAQAALRQRAEDEAALASARYESLREHSVREVVAAQQKAEEEAERFYATYESLRERSATALTAAQREAEENMEQARERYESLCEQMTATAGAAAAAEEAASVAEAAVEKSARDAMAAQETMDERLRAGEQKADERVRQVADEVRCDHQYCKYNCRNCH